MSCHMVETMLWALTSPLFQLDPPGPDFLDMLSHSLLASLLFNEVWGVKCKGIEAEVSSCSLVDWAATGGGVIHWGWGGGGLPKSWATAALWFYSTSSKMSRKPRVDRRVVWGVKILLRSAAAPTGLQGGVRMASFFQKLMKTTCRGRERGEFLQFQLINKGNEAGILKFNLKW